jgi:hypothetical protein
VVVLVLLPPPDIIHHIILPLLTVCEGGLLLDQHAGRSLLVEALLLLEQPHLVVGGFHEEGALVPILLLVDDLPHGFKRGGVAVGVRGRQGVADALDSAKSTLSESSSGCWRRWCGSASVGKMFCSCARALSRALRLVIGL